MNRLFDRHPSTGSWRTEWASGGASLLALLCCAALGCSDKPDAEKAKTITADPKGVTIAADAPQWQYVQLSVAKQGPSLAPLPIPSHVELDEKRSSSLGAPLAGRVESVEVRLGTRVKAGDRLFSVRSGAFADLEREAEGTKAQVEVKKRIAERLKELVDLKVASQKDLLAAEAELHEAELAMRAADSKLRSLSVSASGDNLFWVKAPRTGTVVDLDVFTGQEVTPDRDKPLLRLSDLGEVLVIADVPENDVGDLKLNQPVTVRLHTSGNAEREGIIEGISEVVDAKRRSVEVRVRVVNADRALRPNAYVDVVVHADETQQVVRVPDAAVVMQGGKLVVFVSPSPGRLEPRTVKCGRRRDGETEIRDGLEVGARFVSSGALLLLNQVTLAGGA